VSRSRTVEIGWSHPETEEDFRVVCSLTPGESEIRWGDSARPGCGPEVEILSIAEDAPGGAERPDLLELAQRDFDLISERAVEAAADDDEGEWDAEQDRRSDEAREARLLGEHW
jgi:hypothetical protein